MANFNSWMRSSYFNVEDKEAFLKELAGISYEDMEVVESSTGNGEIALMGSDYATGHKEVFDDNDDLDDEVQVDTFKLIQKHLVDGESVLIECVGHEKLRYVSGYALILTKHREVFLDMEDEIKKKAVAEGLISQEEANSLMNAY